MAGQVTFRDNSNEVISLFQKAKHRGLEAIGLAAEGHAKKNLYPGHGLDTGRLRNSITYAIAGYQTHVQNYRRSNVVGGASQKHKRYEYGGDVMEGEKDSAVFIGSNVEYAPCVEMGAKGRAPLHFLQDAATGHTEEYKKIIKDAMESSD